MDWRHNAVCRDEDPELFFPVGNSGPALAQIADAKLVCNRCPVTTECLSWALESGQDAGVWGGMRPVALSLAYYPSGRRWCWSRGRVRNAHRSLMRSGEDW